MFSEIEIDESFNGMEEYTRDILVFSYDFDDDELIDLLGF